MALLPVSSSALAVETPRNCPSPSDPEELPLSVIETRVEAELQFSAYQSSAPAAGFAVPRATASEKTFPALSVTPVTVTAELAKPSPTNSAAPPSSELCVGIDHVDADPAIRNPVELMNAIAIG